MTTKRDCRVVLAVTLVSAVTIIGLVNPASANSTHVGPAPQDQIKQVNTNVGTTTHTNAPALLPSPGGQPTVLAMVSPGLSPGVVRGGRSTGAVFPESASTGGPQDFIVTATVAQSSDLSTGTFTFDTGDDRTETTVSAAPIAYQTAKEAGLDGVVAPDASGKTLITATVAGAITAPDGSRRMAVDLYGDKLLSFAVDLKTGGKFASKSGQDVASSENAAVIAPGESVTMLASAAGDIVRSTINLAGIHQANGFSMRDGRLVLVFVGDGR